MKFDRPIVFFDLETTGVNPRTDRIVEIAASKFDVDLVGYEDKVKRINPEIPISKQATLVHGITDEDVKDAPTFKQLSKGIFDFISGCDLAGYNIIAFDIPMLYAEFLRAGIEWDYSGVNFYDVCNIYKIRESRTLSDAVKFYLGKEHTEAHSSLADVMATVDVFEKQIATYDLDQLTPQELAEYSNYGKKILDISGKFRLDEDGDVVFAFGKYPGEKAKTQPDYLRWMLGGDFAPDTLKIAKRLYDESFQNVKA